MEKCDLGGRSKPVCYAQNIHQRFVKLLRLLSKFIAIERTHVRPSGWNDDLQFKHLAKLFHACTEVHITDYVLSYNYLKEKPKWKFFLQER
jgi:hypothetical protein